MKRIAVCGTIEYRNEIVLNISKEYIIGCYVEFEE